MDKSCNESVVILYSKDDGVVSLFSLIGGGLQFSFAHTFLKHEVTVLGFVYIFKKKRGKKKTPRTELNNFLPIQKMQCDKFM